MRESAMYLHLPSYLLNIIILFKFFYIEYLKCYYKVVFLESSQVYFSISSSTQRPTNFELFNFVLLRVKYLVIMRYQAISFLILILLCNTFLVKQIFILDLNFVLKLRSGIFLWQTIKVKQTLLLLYQVFRKIILQKWRNVFYWGGLFKHGFRDEFLLVIFFIENVSGSVEFVIHYKFVINIYLI